jgi:hypothetical protein
MISLILDRKVGEETKNNAAWSFQRRGRRFLHVFSWWWLHCSRPPARPPLHSSCTCNILPYAPCGWALESCWLPCEGEEAGERGKIALENLPSKIIPPLHLTCLAPICCISHLLVYFSAWNALSSLLVKGEKNSLVGIYVLILMNCSYTSSHT